MNVDPIVLATVILASIPAVMTVMNCFVFRPPPEPGSDRPQVSILIPARNEESNIEAAVQAALASEGIELEVVVLDDHSTDQTAAIVQKLAAVDPRVRLESAPELPAGWCGKQHACACLAGHAHYDHLFFVDADVQMAPRAVAGMAAFLARSEAGLVSAFPHQVTVTFLEKLLIPLIEFMLLGYLPLVLARLSRSPGFAAGCGQVFLARRDAYLASGGHAAIRESLHDGIKLPRSFRKAGFHTDVCMGEGNFVCRMYRSGREVWAGLLKNAHEGIASVGLILPFTVLLAGAGLLPLVLAVMLGLGVLETTQVWWIMGALVLSFLPRLLNALRFRQSWLGVLLHPLSIVLFLVLQWQSVLRRLAGRRPEWKGREVG